MMTGEAPNSLDQIVVSQHFDLEDLLDRPALIEMTHSFEDLFGVPLRVYSSSGALLADTRHVPRLYRVLERTRSGRIAVQETIGAVRGASPDHGGAVTTECVSGGRYLASAIIHEGRLLGRTILGPVISPEMADLPPRLVEAAEGLDVTEVRDAWAEIARLTDDECARIDAHLRSTLDLLVFSGLKAHLASNMHMASVRESFRELSEKNEKLQTAYNRLKELDRLKSNFLATVSHELRTPLTSIIGYSEMLIEGIAGETNEEQKDFLNTIHEKGEQLLDLIKSLLDLSKLESGTMSLRKTDADCGRVVSEVVSTLTPTARKKGVRLIRSVEGDLPTLHGDPERLRQVLLNLTENAIKFTPPQGTVTVAAQATSIALDDRGGVGGVLMAPVRKSAIRLSVADTGIGISEEERERVFDAFYQVDSSSTRQAGGTGLGLSIVKRLVDAHDGEIRIASNEPSGTVFSVILPILKPRG